ncbi:MAG: tRNA uridine-5-carboxymethylaminomethyl(34) synthesis GTPase MnmE [Oscillospiraceae bacterium]|nr:tRNA uridine-5-carboxymethylaminomethyl(34) synthesis GTPase MnmE [Oscillospiraceae bacterium]
MKTIAAISTPDAAGGIAMIRISGADAFRIAERAFRSADGTKVTEMRGYSCAYGHVYDGETVLDDVVLTVFRAPHSYTGEDTVEITCHGGIYLTKQIILLLYRCGAEPAGPGEFTRRAFENGKLSLSQAEAVMNVIQADGAAALQLANYAKDGKLGSEMRKISDELVDLMSALAYWMDDAEECPPELERTKLSQQLTVLHDKLENMAQNYQNGLVLRSGIRTVLLGKPNAGKSSVMNWICGTDRSIVTSIAGTTRDVITEQVKIGEYTLILSDTAGLRDTDNEIESIGISQAYKTLEKADLVLYVIDASAGMDDTDRETLDRCTNQNVIVIWNKNDISDDNPPVLPYPLISVAAIHEDSVELLADALRAHYGTLTGIHGAMPLNERQNALICKAADALASAVEQVAFGAELDMIYADLECASNRLREIEGANVSEDVIDGVFSKFCVGK